VNEVLSVQSRPVWDKDEMSKWVIVAPMLPASTVWHLRAGVKECMAVTAYKGKHNPESPIYCAKPAVDYKLRDDGTRVYLCSHHWDLLAILDRLRERRNADRG
jgi:hypothetical protein